MKKKVYLAVPYSHPNPEIRQQRFEAANAMAAILLEQENFVYSPISHSHPISLYMENSNDGNFWMENSLAFLVHCDELVVYCLPGWQESKGIKREIEFAEQREIPISYLRRY